MIFALFVMAAQPATSLVELKPKVLVLDFRDDGVGENAVRIIHDTLVAHVSKDPRLDIVSSEDMRRVLDVDAQKRAMGSCSDESCLAEVAGALGAQLMLYGTAGKLGDLVVVNVSLFDARTGKSVGRETVEAGKIEDLPAPLRAAGDRLLAPLGALKGAPSALNDTLWFGGLGLVGAGVLVAAGGLVVRFAMVGARDGATTFADKTNAQVAADTATAVAIGGGVGAVVGGGVLASSFVVE